MSLAGDDGSSPATHRVPAVFIAGGLWKPSTGLIFAFGKNNSFRGEQQSKNRRTGPSHHGRRFESGYPSSSLFLPAILTNS